MRVTFHAGREWRPEIEPSRIRAEHMDRTARELLADDELAHTQWRWTLEAGNGEPIANGLEGYADKADAIHGFELTHRCTLQSAFPGKPDGPWRAYDANTGRALDLEVQIADDTS